MTDRLVEIISDEVVKNLNDLDTLENVSTTFNQLKDELTLPPVYELVRPSLVNVNGNDLSPEEVVRLVRREKGVRNSGIRW